MLRFLIPAVMVLLCATVALAADVTYVLETPGVV